MSERPGREFRVLLRPDGIRVVTKRSAVYCRGWFWLAFMAVLVVVGGAIWNFSKPNSPRLPLREAKVSSTMATNEPTVGGDEPSQPTTTGAIEVRQGTRDGGEKNLQPDRKGEPAGALHPSQGPTGSHSEDVANATGDEPSGIALFPPPGTNPPKSGLIVPDNFELPPGYVRHYQVTDEGKPLPPILMFHPDAELFDSSGNRIPLPLDLVVPPELAPPGLPLKVLQVPDTAVPFIELPEESSGDAPAVIE